MTFVTTKSLNKDAIPCKIAIGYFTVLIRRLQIFKIELGSLFINDSANVINTSSGTAPIRLIMFD